MSLLKIIASTGFLILTLTGYLSYAQNKSIVDNEILLKEYLQKTRFDIDTSAQAVVLYEKGYATLLKDDLEYHVERTIKILGTEAISQLGTVSIPYGQNIVVSKIKGITYNLEQGKIVEHVVEKSNILSDKMADNSFVYKFNLPEIKAGSVIHVSYTVNRPGFIFVPEWTFQEQYPKLYSSYQISIPNYIVYTALERINVPMKVTQSEGELASCPNGTFTQIFNNNGTNQSWVRSNIPAFKDEPFMDSEDNFKERVKIHVSSLSANGNSINIYNNWEDIINKSYYTNDDMGGQVYANNNFLSEKIKELTLNKTTELEKAQVIFAFVRNNFTRTSAEYGRRVSSNIKDVFFKKEGTPLGINLLLTAMLIKAGLNSEPVLMSTRANEKLNPVFPDPEKINYVVCKVNIDKKDYMLDATIKELPFGVLLPTCYNGYCRTVKEKAGIINLEPDNIKDRTNIMATIMPHEKDKTKLTLKVDRQFGIFSGLGPRTEWKKDTTEIKKIIEKELSGATVPTKLKSYTVDNLNDPDKPLTLHYEAEIEFNDLGKSTTIYFDPYFEKFFDKNPFKPGNRTFNISMDYQEDINYILRLKLPEGYAVDDFPKSSIYHLNEKQLLTLKNIMDYNTADGTFTLNSRLIRLNTSFAAAENTELRKFYENVMEEQSKKLIIKKIN